METGFEKVLSLIESKFPDSRISPFVKLTVYLDGSGEVSRGSYSDSQYECLVEFHSIGDLVSELKNLDV